MLLNASALYYVDLRGISCSWTALEIGPVIIRAAQRHLDGGGLADWLRQQA